MAGYKSYRKSKVKNYQKGGKVGAGSGPGEHTTDWSKSQNTSPHRYPGVGIAGGYMYNAPSYAQYPEGWTGSWADLNPPDQPYYQKGGKVGAGSGSGEQTPNAPPGWGSSPSHERWGRRGAAQIYDYWQNAYPPDPRTPQPYYGYGFGDNPPDAPPFAKGGKVGAGPGSGEHTPDANYRSTSPSGQWGYFDQGTGRMGHIGMTGGTGNSLTHQQQVPSYPYGFSAHPPDQPVYAKGGKVGAGPGSGEQTPREPVFDWSKRVGTTPGYAHWGGVGRAQMLGPTTMGGYAGGPASMDQYYGWGQPNPPWAPLYEKGGKVMDQYLDGKKKTQVKKKDKVKAMTKTSKKEVKTIPKEKPMKKATKEGGVELIKSMRGMTFRQLKDLNKKMVRG